MDEEFPKCVHSIYEIKYRDSDADWAELHRWVRAATETWLDAHSDDTRNPWLMPDLTSEERIARFQHTGGFMPGFLDGSV